MFFILGARPLASQGAAMRRLTLLLILPVLLGLLGFGRAESLPVGDRLARIEASRNLRVCI